MLLLLPARYTGTADIWIALLWYGLGKLFEALDGQIYELTHVISGHSLKHLATAAAAWWFLRMLRRRVPLAPPQEAPDLSFNLFLTQSNP